MGQQAIFLQGGCCRTGTGHWRCGISVFGNFLDSAAWSHTWSPLAVVKALFCMGGWTKDLLKSLLTSIYVIIFMNKICPRKHWKSLWLEFLWSWLQRASNKMCQAEKLLQVVTLWCPPHSTERKDVFLEQILQLWKSRVVHGEPGLTPVGFYHPCSGICRSNKMKPFWKYQLLVLFNITWGCYRTHCLRNWYRLPASERPPSFPSLFQFSNERLDCHY